VTRYLMLAAVLLAACDPPARKPNCGRDTTIYVAPVGVSDSTREVRLTPVCKEGT